MKRLPFKRHLILLGVVVLLIGVMVPLATFAKSAHGEPHNRPSQPPKVTMKTNPTTGKNDPTATIQQGCPPSGPIPAPSFSAGDVVSITNATLTSTDPNEGTSSDPSEPLNIWDTTGQLATQTNPKVVGVNQTASYTFTATAGDQLFACINGFDSDETGTIDFTVTTPVPVPTPPPPPHSSSDKLIEHLRDIIMSLRPHVDLDRLNTFLDAFSKAQDIKACAMDITEGVSHAVPIVIPVPTPEGIINEEVDIPQFPVETAKDCADALPDIIDVLSHTKVDKKDTPLFFFFVV